MTQAEPFIVVVDDDADVLKALKRLLRSLAYLVHTFSSGTEFLECPLETEPGCMIVDVQMPGMNGMELHRRMRAAKRFVPFIFITAHDDPRTRLYAEQAGAAFLLKPVSDHLLQAALQAALEPPRTPAPMPTLTLSPAVALGLAL
jgi:FixJ family two-component response regulator